MATRLVASLPATFLTFVAVGAGVILTFSWSHRTDPGGASHWTMTAVVVALMVAYGIVLWLRARTAYASDTDGETFYYLGFIYTLATLVATFAPLLNSAERPESRHVLGLFGLGLITTFVGLAGRIVFAQWSPAEFAGPEADARRLGDVYAEAAYAIERSTVRIVNAQQRAEGHLSESYTGAVGTIRNMSDRVTQQFDSMSAQVLKQFAAALERVGADAEAAFAEVRNRAVADVARVAQESSAALAEFLGDTNAKVGASLQQLDARVEALRLPPEDFGEKLAAVLSELAERADLLRRTTTLVTAAYGELETALATAVKGARAGGRAFNTLAASADAAASAVTSATTNVEHFAAHVGQVGELTTGLEQVPREAATITASLSGLRENLGEANRAWAEVAGVADATTRSMAKAGAALSAFEQGTRAAEQSVLNWSGGLTKAGVGLQAMTEMTERALRLGKEAVDSQVRLSTQISGPLAEQLRQHSQAAGALAHRLQEDLRTSEEAMRRVHHHLIDASRFILSKVEYRR
jgi:hypothetical protein